MFVLTGVLYRDHFHTCYCNWEKIIPYIILGGRVIFYRGLIYLGGINVPSYVSQL